MPSGRTTYKNLFLLVREQIDRSVQFRNTPTFDNQINSDSLTLGANSIFDIRAVDLINSLQKLLQETLPGFISEGLEVEATTPVSSSVIVRQGNGSKAGFFYETTDDITVKIPFDREQSVFYVSLYKDNIIVEKNPSVAALQLAKIVIPSPGKTQYLYDTRDERPNPEVDGYILGLKVINLYGDAKGRLEDDSLEFFRDNIGRILADNLIGNIRLSENLKITNVHGTMELNSDSMKLYDVDSNLLAKLNKNGTFFYDANGVEVARFATDSARIGNILVTKSNIGSNDFVSENRGFRIEDTGYAEFQDVRIRGRISSSVFEYDKVSAVSGKLIVGSASALESNMLALDSATLTVKDGVFNVGDILLIKDGVEQEYLEVTDDTNEPTYTVIRDIASSYNSNNNPAWPKGTAVVSTGNASSGIYSGFITLDAVSQYSPFIDINKRNSDIYNDWSTKVRLGNLSGITDSLYGTLTGYGLYSDNVYLRGKLYAPDIRTAITGSRIILDTDKLLAYDDSDNEIFRVNLESFSGGSDIGDVIIGNYTGGSGAKWDASSGTFDVKGEVSASTISGNLITAVIDTTSLIFQLVDLF